MSTSSTSRSSGVDVLAIGAHPDDVDISVGGTVAGLAARGRTVFILDLTRGEGGSRGTPEERLREAEQAASVLGVADRMCLDMGDTRLENTLDNRSALVAIIRRYRPVLVLAPWWEDLHPDHAAAGAIVRDTMYPSGMAGFPASGAPYRPNEVLFYMAHLPFQPS
ncbi:PIG-L family deacetylase, partial [Candidatus Fermentibacterales bacterium]|nr:PIG-L family deacetylase [Candidatus Fermentibacterales bacterium]